MSFRIITLCILFTINANSQEINMLKIGDKAPAINSIDQNGEQISLVEEFKQIPSVILAVQSKDRDVPEYLTVDYIKMKGVFVKSPVLKDVPYPVEMEPNLVVEFYSR